MRKIFATAAAAGIVAIGLAAGPAQAATTTQNSTTGLSSQCRHTETILTDFHVVDTALTGNPGDGLFSKDDLWAIAKGRNGASGNLRVAAAKLADGRSLRSRIWFRTLDTAYPGHKGKADGLVSHDDVKSYLIKYCW